MLTPTPLLADAEALAASARDRLPVGLADAIERRIGDVVAGTRAAPPAGVSDAELLVVDLAEQFAIDAHGIDDAQVERVREHYRDDEVVAIMFHFALSDGLAKLRAVNGAADRAAGAGSVSDATRQEFR